MTGADLTGRPFPVRPRYDEAHGVRQRRGGEGHDSSARIVEEATV
jgi:hypothetical protein